MHASVNDEPTAAENLTSDTNGFGIRQYLVHKTTKEINVIFLEKIDFLAKWFRVKSLACERKVGKLARCVPILQQTRSSSRHAGNRE